MTRDLLHRAFAADKAARCVHLYAVLNAITIAAMMAWLVVLGSAE